MMLGKYIKKFLNEMPMRSIQHIGNWEKRGAFSNQDLKLLSNPKAIEKIQSQWSKTEQNFDIYLLNIPMLNKVEYREYGEVKPGSDVDELIQKALKQPTPRSPDAITILFNGNKGEQKVPMTGWIMAHRFGHALRRRHSQDWEDYEDEVNYVLSEILDAFHNMERMFKAGYQIGDVKPARQAATDGKYEMLKYIMQQLGTFRSARMNKVRNATEFYHELLAQYLITGGIKFNPLPSRLLVRRGSYGRGEYTYSKDPDYLEQVNEALPDYAEGIEARLRNLLHSAVGKTFLM